MKLTHFFSFALLMVLLIGSSCKTETKTDSLQNQPISVLDTLKTASDFYPADRAKVLVLGTFHFEYPGLDTHKTSDDDKIDVLAEPKKSELEDLIAHIKKFKPNKIAIEARPTWNTMEKLAQYKNGDHADKRDERYTIGMRLTQDLQLDTLYGIDATALINDLHKKDSVLINSLFNQIDWEAEDPYWLMAKKWLDYDDKLIPKMHLLDYFKYMNSRETHLANYGLYLTGEITTPGNQGADHLSMWWYNRNLRILVQGERTDINGQCSLSNFNLRTVEKK